MTRPESTAAVAGPSSAARAGPGAAPPAAMRAAVLYGRDDLRLEERPRPTAGPGEIVVRVRRCGVCGSDLRTYARGPSARYIAPVVLGHEFVGTIAEVGPDVGELAVDQRVTVAPAIPCGRCDACRRGADNLCADLLDFGINIDGGLAEYVRIPARSVTAGAVVVLPEGLTDEAAILGEPIGCCLRGLRRGGVGAGSTVVVIGDGPIGLTHAILARELGAARILCVGHNVRRLEAMERARAETLVVDPAETSEPAGAVLAALGGAGARADTVIAAAPDPRAIETAVRLIRDGGSVVAFGGLAGDPAVTIDGNRLHYGEWSLIGSFNCTTAEFRAAIDLAGRLDTGLFETTLYPLDRIVEAFEAARTRAILKAVITMERPT